MVLREYYINISTKPVTFPCCSQYRAGLRVASHRAFASSNRSMRDATRPGALRTERPNHAWPNFDTLRTGRRTSYHILSRPLRGCRSVSRLDTCRQVLQPPIAAASDAFSYAPHGRALSEPEKTTKGMTRPVFRIGETMQLAEHRNVMRPNAASYLIVLISKVIGQPSQDFFTLFKFSLSALHLGGQIANLS
ncbi:hypothetical protein AnigIFM59636_008612 [Aspergillus niger]|nr:hypothetical protein AnigIFM59636_008612 [Aspergillus niger]